MEPDRRPPPTTEPDPSPDLSGPLGPILAQIARRLATSPDPTGQVPPAPSLPAIFSAVSSTVTDLTPDDRETILALLMAGLDQGERDHVADVAMDLAGWLE